MKGTTLKLLPFLTILFIASCGGGSGDSSENGGDKSLSEASDSENVNFFFQNNCQNRAACTWTFDTSISACFQSGIICDADDNVTQIRLENKGLSGEIPASLANLDELIILDLSNNLFTGGIPSELEKLAHLQVLNLENNNLVGEVPAELSTFPGLAELMLKDNSFTCEPLVDYSEWAIYTDYHEFNCQPCLAPSSEKASTFLDTNSIETPLHGAPIGCSDEREFAKVWKKIPLEIARPHEDIRVEDAYVYASSEEYIYWMAFVNNDSDSESYCFIQASNIKYLDADGNQIETDGLSFKYVDGYINHREFNDGTGFLNSSCLWPNTRGVFIGIDDSRDFFNRLDKMSFDVVEANLRDNVLLPEARIVHGGAYSLNTILDSYYELEFEVKNVGSATAFDFSTTIVFLNSNGEPLKWTIGNPAFSAILPDGTLLQTADAYDALPSDSMLVFPNYDLNSFLFSSVSAQSVTASLNTDEEIKRRVVEKNLAISREFSRQFHRDEKR